MATRPRTMEFLLDQLASVRDVRARKMFGEYAIYVGGKVVALVCDDQMFVKVTDAGRVLVGARYKEGFAYPGAKASILVAADDIEDAERLAELVQLTAAALPAPKPKAPAKAKAKAKAKPPAIRLKKTKAPTKRSGRRS